MDENNTEKSFKEKLIYGKGAMNLPNKLTIFRMILIPVFVAFFFVNFPGHYFVALAVFLIAGATDLLDGKIARHYKLVTNLGKFLDPIADKVLVATVFILFLAVSETFFCAFLDYDWMMIVSSIGVAVILARELIISGFRLVASDSGVVIAADMVGKYKTTFQDICIILYLVCAGAMAFTQGIGVEVINYISLGIFAVAVILTIISGINYIVRNRAVLKI